MTDNLLPCPFCGGKANYHAPTSRMICQGCTASVDANIHPGVFKRWDRLEEAERCKATELWNRRAALPPHPRADDKAAAFDRIVAAHVAYVKAVDTYNARLAVVNAERARGNWGTKLDPEYGAMLDAQMASNKTTRTEILSALSTTASEGDTNA